MAYCRWSSDNWNSDVYVFEHYNGLYCIMVRGSVYPKEFPVKPNAGEMGEEEYAQKLREYGKLLVEVKMEKFDMPLAGQTIELSSLPQLYEKLIWMQQSGYNVPQFALDTIFKEMKEMEHG